MNTIKTAAASVVGARHLRVGRNGQDAVAVWTGHDVAVVVVADGCSSGASSEVGARLGASVFARAVGARLAAGMRLTDQATWEAARTELVGVIAGLVEHLPAEREQAIHDTFLFTLVAAAACGDQVAVWAIGDGVYALDDDTHVLGPHAENQPPYVAYDLLGDAQPAHFAIARDCDTVVIATDGASDIPGGLRRFVDPKLVAHPDALRRQLTVLARAAERIVWDERHVARTPAVLQDDCAVAILHRSGR